ncbi:MAG: radical SAM protein [Proteobacteria bacterium]|nr:radical SAM protein [Pseudomonadota bacterium]
MNRTDAGGTYRPAWPMHVVWLATNACTARCLHCSSNSAKRSPDEMSTAQAIDMVDQLAGCGVVDFGISGGEPLLRRDLLEIASHAKAHGMSVGIATNGAKLPQALAERMAMLGLDRLQVSLDGPPAEHDRLRRWPGLHERATQSIRTARRAGLRVHVCCTITSLNVGVLDAFVENLLEHDVQRLNFSRYVPTGRRSDALDLPDEQWHMAIAHCAALKSRYRGRLEIVTHLAQQILVDDEVADMPAFIGCQAGRGQACISANGTVMPCVLLPLPLGSLRTASFRAIWEDSSHVRRLQEREHLHGSCGGCLVRDRCGGCRAVAYARTGDYLASDPRCWLPAEWSTVAFPPRSKGARHGTDSSIRYA